MRAKKVLEKTYLKDTEDYFREEGKDFYFFIETLVSLLPTKDGYLTVEDNPTGEGISEEDIEEGDFVGESPINSIPNKDGYFVSATFSPDRKSFIWGLFPRGESCLPDLTFFVGV